MQRIEAEKQEEVISSKLNGVKKPTTCRRGSRQEGNAGVQSEVRARSSVDRGRVVLNWVGSIFFIVPLFLVSAMGGLRGLLIPTLVR